LEILALPEVSVSKEIKAAKVLVGSLAIKETQDHQEVLELQDKMVVQDQMEVLELLD